MAAAWVWPSTVLKLCDFALKQALKARDERFDWMTRQDHSEGLGGLINWITRTKYDPALYQWVWQEDGSGMSTSALILRMHIYGRYDRIERRANELRALANLKSTFSEANVSNLGNEAEADLNVLPPLGVWLTDQDLKDLDLKSPVIVKSAHDPQPT